MAGEGGLEDTQWDALLRIAYDVIDQAGIGRNWSFGGGTALMIQIDHRISHDIDIFIYDPQYLGYFDPVKQDFKLQIPPSDYRNDGSRFQKLVFPRMGEIDFIVGQDITGHPSLRKTVEGREINIDTVEEIIAKKIYYRGSYITPRDVFDVAAACQSHRVEIIAALREIKSKVASTLDVINNDRDEYLQCVISNLNIKPHFHTLRSHAKSVCLEVLNEVLST